jgi:hypothetical protein
VSLRVAAKAASVRVGQTAGEEEAAEVAGQGEAAMVAGEEGRDCGPASRERLRRRDGEAKRRMACGQYVQVR